MNFIHETKERLDITKDQKWQKDNHNKLYDKGSGEDRTIYKHMAGQGSENIWEMRHRCKQSVTSQGDSKTQDRLTESWNEEIETGTKTSVNRRVQTPDQISDVLFMNKLALSANSL